MSLLTNAERHLRTFESVGVVSDQVRKFVIVLGDMIDDKADQILERVTLMQTDVDLRLDRMSLQWTIVLIGWISGSIDLSQK